MIMDSKQAIYYIFHFIIIMFIMLMARLKNRNCIYKYF